jgi:hypothetical protein
MQPSGRSWRQVETLKLEQHDIPAAVRENTSRDDAAIRRAPADFVTNPTAADPRSDEDDDKYAAQHEENDAHPSHD